MIFNTYDPVDMRDFFSLDDAEQLLSLDNLELTEPPDLADGSWTPF